MMEIKHISSIDELLAVYSEKVDTYVKQTLEKVDFKDENVRIIYNYYKGNTDYGLFWVSKKASKDTIHSFSLEIDKNALQFVGADTFKMEIEVANSDESENPNYCFKFSLDMLEKINLIEKVLFWISKDSNNYQPNFLKEIENYWKDSEKE